MGCKIIFAPQAIADHEEAVRHIARHEPEAALRIGNALIDRAAFDEFSESWPCPEESASRETVRVFHVICDIHRKHDRP